MCIDRDKLKESKRQKKKKDRNLSDVSDKEVNNVHTKNKSKNDEEADEQTSEMVKTRKKKRKKRDAENKDRAADESPMIEDEEPEKSENNLEKGKRNDNDKNTREEIISPPNGFMILGAKSQKKQRAVKRILPDWLAHPEVIPTDLSSGPSLEELDLVLDPNLIKVLRTNGIVKLFPVQSSIINWLNKCNKDRKMGWWPRDTCVSAPTGSGKCMQ